MWVTLQMRIVFWNLCFSLVHERILQRVAFYGFSLHASYLHQYIHVYCYDHGLM